MAGENNTYRSKYFTAEEIDQRLLQGYYDDAVNNGYTGTKENFLSDLLSSLSNSNKSLGAIYIGEFPTIQEVWAVCKQIALNTPEISIIKYSVKQGITYNSGVVFQSFNYNDHLVTQYYFYGGGQKHECNVRHIVTDGTEDTWQPLHIYTSFSFENGSLYGYRYGKGTSSTNKIEIVKIPNATISKAGLLAPEDKSKLNNLAKIGDSYDLNTYMEEGVYLIRTASNEAKNYPVQTPADSVLRLTVTGSYDGTNWVIVQVLNMNNHVGGEGGIYIRSCQGGTWKPWAKLQTNVEVGLIDQTKMDDLTDNGIYSGILSTTGETFVIICINNYAIAQQVGIQHISHLKYSLVVGTGEIKIEKRTRDAYGIWTEWENIGGSSTLPKATLQTIGGVRLGTSKMLETKVMLGADNSGAAGISIGEGLTASSDGSVLYLDFGDNAYGKPITGIPLFMGTAYKLADIPLFSGTSKPVIPLNTDYFGVDSKGLTINPNAKFGDSTTKVTWDASSNMNDFKTAGVYDIYGERTRQDDNLPILNASSGHSIAARLTVVASTLQPANNEICVTQFLMLSNRRGGEGNMYVRTYNENNSPAADWWTPWQKLQGVNEGYIFTDSIQVNPDGGTQQITGVTGLNNMVDNGIYSGIYTDDPTFQAPTFIDTFTLIVINNYAVAGKDERLKRTISQLKYAVDAITNQASVKMRTKTDGDTAWSDWKNIGGVETQEVDVTDAVKAYGLPALASQGLVNDKTLYSAYIIGSENLPMLDVSNKIKTFLLSKHNGSALIFKFYLEKKTFSEYNCVYDIQCYATDASVTWKYYHFVVSGDLSKVSVSESTTVL